MTNLEMMKGDLINQIKKRLRNNIINFLQRFQNTIIQKQYMILL